MPNTFSDGSALGRLVGITGGCGLMAGSACVCGMRVCAVSLLKQCFVNFGLLSVPCKDKLYRMYQYIPSNDLS